MNNERLTGGSTEEIKKLKTERDKALLAVTKAETAQAAAEADRDKAEERAGGAILETAALKKKLDDLGVDASTKKGFAVILTEFAEAYVDGLREAESWREDKTAVAPETDAGDVAKARQVARCFREVLDAYGMKYSQLRELIALDAVLDSMTKNALKEMERGGGIG